MIIALDCLRDAFGAATSGIFGGTLTPGEHYMSINQHDPETGTFTHRVDKQEFEHVNLFEIRKLI
jgi:hypothetical protein